MSWLRHNRRHLAALLPILLVAAAGRAALILSDGVSFDSDEAVVGLMARHINQGEPIPVFFYGQDYMGSLDAVLVALGFRALGESVRTIRAVQMVLYLLALVAAYALAWTVTRRRRVAALTLLLLAVPTPLGALYTTLTLGGYNELVLFGSLILLLSWQLTLERRDEAWRWALIGLMAGMGWWTNGAILTACLVAGLLGLYTFAPRRWRGYALAAAFFMIGSAPWWVYNLRHEWAALAFLTGGFGAAPGAEPLTPVEALIALGVLGFPALYGLRYPWQPELIWTPAAGIAWLVLLVLTTDGLVRGYARRRAVGAADTLRHAERWVWLVFGVFAVLFAASPFSDSTGRYLMPLWTPAAIGVALGLDRLRRAGWLVTALAASGLLVFQAASVIRAAGSEVGLQPQLIERLQTPPDYDQPLLDWLVEQGYTRGYAPYWASYRLMFRAGEAVIFDTSLPYAVSGYVSGNNRYAPYVAEVARAERVIWLTHNFPELDALIARRLAERGIRCHTRGFGPYRVYYDFSTRISPAELGLTAPGPLPKSAGLTVYSAYSSPYLVRR